MPLSAFLASCLAWLKAHTTHRFVISYADTGHGHHGGIYQATGFVYVGARGQSVDGFVDRRGRVYHKRSAYDLFGTSSVRKVLKARPGWRVLPGSTKHLYIFPLRQRRGSILREFKWTALPYPKPKSARSRDLSTRRAGTAPVRAGRNPPRSLQIPRRGIHV